MSASQYHPFPVLEIEEEPQEYEYYGCGWYESSYELQKGAEVEEGLSLEEFQLWVKVAEKRAADQMAAVQP